MLDMNNSVCFSCSINEEAQMRRRIEVNYVSELVPEITLADGSKERAFTLTAYGYNSELVQILHWLVKTKAKLVSIVLTNII